MLRKSACLWFLLAAVPVYADQNVVVVLDDSGSMNEQMRSNRRLTKMDAAKEALLKVLEGLPTDTKVGIVLLNGGRGTNRWVYPLAIVDPARLRAGIQRISAHGSTPLGERMKEGCDKLLSLRNEEHYGSYRLLVVTDGEASDGDLVERYLPDILARGIWLGAIGVDMDGNHSLATKVHTYRKADNPEDLIGAIREFMAEFPDDDTDADQADMELLAALPNEVATAALEALAQPRNHPIGEQPPGVAEEMPPTTTAGEPAAPYGQPTQRPEQVAKQMYLGGLCGGLACVAIAGALILAALFVVGSASRRKR